MAEYKDQNNDLHCDEKVTLLFANDHNQIELVEEDYYTPTIKPDGSKKSVIRESVYKLKVTDADSGSTMYYDVSLNRVELLKKKNTYNENEGGLSEHLEVIAQLDDEEENPFNSEFEDAHIDYAKSDD